MSIVEKINKKYLGTLDYPLVTMLIANTGNGIEAVFEITPKFFYVVFLVRLNDPIHKYMYWSSLTTTTHRKDSSYKLCFGIHYNDDHYGRPPEFNPRIGFFRWI
jgi:hypothetical protein